ncbi:hypothetical protein HHK36_012197 [Tetracentron sinense]|uniref:Stress-response A/B barrel domain-containing protein n=1 Tax=Tetracentron sinense TaxID=13715 RepID=A0A834Z5E0_TETSI|nr:hypothetical protein HHK36_012197 [Tetracentron sinense]
MLQRMEEAKGVVKHVLMAKFKDGTPPDKIEQLIKDYASLVDFIEPMKAFHWYPLSLFLHISLLQISQLTLATYDCLLFLRNLGSDAKQALTYQPGGYIFTRLYIHEKGKDVSSENLHQGFTHVFESTFESVEAIAEYVAHPAHDKFANEFLPTLEKVIIIDYKPTTTVNV